MIYFVFHAFKTNKERHWIYIIILVPGIGALIYFFVEFLPSLQEGRSATHNVEFITGKQAGPSPKDYKLGYLTRGKLFYKHDASPPGQIQSRFGQKIIDRTIEMGQKNEWKTKDSGSLFGGGRLWGVDKANVEVVRVNITCAAQGLEEDEVYFILESDTTGGLFLYDCRNNEERRLFHKENFHAKDLDIHPETGELLCSQYYPNGTANVVLIDKKGGNSSQISEGDSIDEAPSWMPGEERRVLFQTSGVARNADGWSIGRGAASIQALDLDNNRLTPVLENPQYDYLQPRISPDGYMYYIRRPYETPRYSPNTFIGDFFLFPFRLIRAVFHYLNFFSLVYTKKPLKTAGGPEVREEDLKDIVLKGKRIDAEKALRKGIGGKGVPSLVPPSWTLVKRDSNGREEVVARSVVSFSIRKDGAIVYTNGCGVFLLDDQKRSRLIIRDNLIEEVI